MTGDGVFSVCCVIKLAFFFVWTRSNFVAATTHNRVRFCMCRCGCIERATPPKGRSLGIQTDWIFSVLTIKIAQNRRVPSPPPYHGQRLNAAAIRRVFCKKSLIASLTRSFYLTFPRVNFRIASKSALDDC